MKSLKVKNSHAIDMVAMPGTSISEALHKANELSEQLGVKINLDYNGFSIVLPSLLPITDIIKNYKNRLKTKRTTDYWDSFEKKPSYTDKVSQHYLNKHGNEGSKYKPSSEFYTEALRRAEDEREAIREMEEKPNPYKIKNRLLQDDKYRLRALNQVQVAI